MVLFFTAHRSPNLWGAFLLEIINENGLLLMSDRLIVKETDVFSFGYSY